MAANRRGASLARFLRDASGSGVVSYGLLAGLTAMAAISSISAAGLRITDVFAGASLTLATRESFDTLSSCQSLADAGIERVAGSGSISVDPDGGGPLPPVEAMCDFAGDGPAVTLVPGSLDQPADSDELAGACPGGTTPFAATTLARAEALNRWILTQPEGQWFYANIVAGVPGVDPAEDSSRAAMSVGTVDAAGVFRATPGIEECNDGDDGCTAIFANLDISANVNTGGNHDPIPMLGGVGFINRGDDGQPDYDPPVGRLTEFSENSNQTGQIVCLVD